jgi:hypothetical protein
MSLEASFVTISAIINYLKITFSRGSRSMAQTLEVKRSTAENRYAEATILCCNAEEH